MGATGYSYGGFLTNWVITHTPRFAAAIVGAGISNWISDYGTADIPRTKESEFNGPPWEPASLELLLKQSPVIYAKNVTTPTLFIHGEADLRVPIEQASRCTSRSRSVAFRRNSFAIPICTMVAGRLGTRCTGITRSCSGGQNIWPRSRHRRNSVCNQAMSRPQAPSLGFPGPHVSGGGGRPQAGNRW